MKLPVHRIIPFSNVEGIGNRTSIFVQGCNANCLYCHNAETIPKKYDQVAMYTVDDLISLIQKNMPFIRGITVSGGEATLYPGFLRELFEGVHKLGLTCYIDTNGFYDLDALSPLVEGTDKFLFDLKGLGDGLVDLCFSNDLLEGQSINQSYKQRFGEEQEHLHNLESLLAQDKVEEVRLVYVKGFYDVEEVLKSIAQVLIDYPQVPLKLIRVHGKGLPLDRLKRLKGAIPTKDDFYKAENLARELGIKRIVSIL